MGKANHGEYIAHVQIFSIDECESGEPDDEYRREVPYYKVSFMFLDGPLAGIHCKEYVDEDYIQFDQL